MATIKTYPLDQHVEEHGLTLRVNISFLKETKDKMSVVSFSISDGYKTSDYRFVLGETTLENVLEDFLTKY